MDAGEYRLDVSAVRGPLWGPTMVIRRRLQW